MRARRRTLNLLKSHRSQVHREPRRRKIQTGHRATPLAAALVGLDLLVLGRLFQFLTMFIIVLFDFVYAFPEFCSVVSHEVGGLQRLGVLVQFIVALRIGICDDTFLLTSR